MGYLLTAHVTRTKPDVRRLAELPTSIGTRMYHHRAADVYLLDTFRPDRGPGYPFQTPLPAADIPLELPPELGELEAVYSYLMRQKRANAFKKSYVNFGLLLHQLWQLPLLSFVSDDDGLDFACVIDQGRLERLQFMSNDLRITYEAGRIHIQPFAPEMEDDDEFATDLDELRRALPMATVEARDSAWPGQLHGVALDQWQKFSGRTETILGLGSFDPPEDEAEWVEIACS